MRFLRHGFVALALAGVGAFLTAPLAWAQTLAWDPSFLDFGVVSVGDTAYGTLTLTNTDEVDPLVVSNVEFTYSQQDQFGFTTSEPLAAVLLPGESMQVVFSFAPITFSFALAEAVVTNDSTNAPSLVYSMMGYWEEVDLCAPLTDCGGACVETDTDVANCGACGNVCPDPPGGLAACVAGVCTMDCGALTNCDGVCLDTSGDVFNCGACGTVCPDPPGGTAVCNGGVCGNDCGALADCGGACVDLLSDPLNCGTCGFACPDVLGGTPVCLAGACASDCGALTDCSGACVDTSTNVFNCGACGNACPAPENATALCTDGGCSFVCDPGYEPVGDECRAISALTPAEMLEALIAFVDEAVADGRLVGLGTPGAILVQPQSAAHRLLVFTRALDRALEHLIDGEDDDACERLDYAQIRSDGGFPFVLPPDFVAGEATGQVHEGILEIMAAMDACVPREPATRGPGR